MIIPLWLQLTLLCIFFATAGFVALMVCVAFGGMIFGAVMWLYTGDYPFTHPWMEG